MGEPRTLLVAEDDDAARALVQKYLENKGYRVLAVADGQRALDTLEHPPPGERIDLVLLDVMMPQLSGFEVLTRTRARGDTIPIIMATAASSNDDVVRALELGADDYVTKPYSFPVLLARLELRLRQRGTTNPPRELPKPPPLPHPTQELDLHAIEEAGEFAEPSFMGRLRNIAKRLTGGRPPPPLELVRGTVIAERYLVEDKLGEGGYGTVYRARHMDLQQDVAVKLLRASGDKAVASFRKEAQNACRVRHDNAVRVYDFGLLAGGSAFLVMELLHGQNLEQVLLQEGRLEPPRALRITQEVLQALAAAHAQGIVHRDVKPGNVLLQREAQEERAKLLDFGIAKDLMDEHDSGGVVLGSGCYAAPERLRGQSYDGRADVYACGIMLYRLLTGAFPFDVSPNDLEELGRWHLTAPPPAPSARLPALPAGVDALVLCMMSKEPGMRPHAHEALNSAAFTADA